LKTLAAQARVPMIFATLLATASPASADDGLAFVHLESVAEGDVTLEARSGSAWAVVCTAPCDRRLPVDVFYRLSGSTRESPPFRLLANAGDSLRLTAKTSSRAAYGTGVALTILGGIGIVTGAVAVVVNSVDFVAHLSTFLTRKQADPTFAYASLLTGAAVSLVGIALIATNGPSRVAQATSVPLPDEPRTAPPVQPAVGFRESHVVISIPVLSGTF
jgi:hypothetical protein